MPRSLILGNGSVLATFDNALQLRDLYFPHVGMEDHTPYGGVHRLGFFVEDKGFAWTTDEGWTIDIDYATDTLVGVSHLRNEALDLDVEVHDWIHPVHNILFRRFLVRSISKQEIRVRIFLHHDFFIYGDKQKDTAFYEPYTNCVIHYRQRRYFLVGGDTDHPQECSIGKDADAYASILHSRKKLSTCGISSFSIGKAHYRGLEGTWRDAEDGELSRHAVEQGSVDSTVGVHCMVPTGERTEVTTWLCLGKTLEEVIDLQELTIQETPDRLLRNTNNYWRSWANKPRRDFGNLPENIVSLFRRSLLTIRMHADREGGIVAAADSDIMAFNRDTYTYVWPRDGAFITVALDRAGYGEVSRKFFDFCTRVQSKDGYMLHKYNPDGSLGSTWHTWYKDGKLQLPIQEDETALVIYAMQQHFAGAQDFEFLQNLFENFIKEAANFLVSFVDEETGLPLQSYDPWEEQRGIFTYTTASTIAGLQAAANISQILGHHHHTERYEHAADRMKQAMLFHLYDEEHKRFIKKITFDSEGNMHKDATPDASMSVIWRLGVLPISDPRVVSTMQSLRDLLWVKTDIGGMARYTTDWYHAAVPPSEDIPGNPWIITTLWHAQWLIANAKTNEDLQEPLNILQWVATRATKSGLLPEQVHPMNGQPLSVAPLAWSHAVFIECVLDYIAAQKRLLQAE